MRTHVKDLVLGIAVASIFGAVMLFVIPAEVRVPRSLPIPANSPAFWPRLVCAFMIVLGIVLAVSALMRLRSNLDFGVDKAVDETAYPPLQALLRVFLAVITLIGYYAVVHWIGIVVASTLAFISLSLLYGERRYWLILIISVLLPLALYIFFVKVAHVSLPLVWLAA